jgi:predicted acetyltransferase
MSSQTKPFFAGDAAPELIVRPLQPAEIATAADLVARAFSRGDARRYEHLLHDRLAHLPTKPGFHPEDYQGGFVEGKLVSLARVEQHTLYYGLARLKVAGISDICTDSAYRHRGYSGVIVRDTIASVAGQGAHLALLYDRSNYYQRYGFTTVWPDYYLQFTAQELQSQTMPLTVRPVRPNDAPALAALYERHWQGRLAFRRGVELWHWRLAAAEALPVVAIEGGSPVGYLWHNDHMNVSEVVADTPAATLALMIYAAQQADNPHHAVRWSIPPDDAIAAFAGMFATVILSATYRPHSGWMARLIQPAELVATLLPEIIAQAKSVDPTLENHRLLLEVQPDEVVIGMKPLPETTVRFSHRDFMQVLFGSLRPAVLALRAQLSLPQVQLLETLFPARMAALAVWDWF